MPSDTIKNNRRKRRHIKRYEKRKKIYETYDQSSILSAPNHVIVAIKRASKSLGWKGSVQLANLLLFSTCADISNTIVSHSPLILMLLTIFKTQERGKVRTIQSVNMNERVEQHVLCDRIIYPVITRSFIYDNAASLVDRGINFSIKRVVRHLRSFFNHHKKFSNEGVVIQIDISGFFASIDHKICLDMIKKYFHDEHILDNVTRIVNSFTKDGDDVGLGLGSQLCQLLALLYLNTVDHYAKEVLSLKWYIRYMDDILIFCKTKDEANYILEKMTEKLNGLKLEINIKKTKIQSMDRPFIFLQKKFRLTETGKIIIHDSSKSIKRMNKKMKKIRELLDKNSIDISYVDSLYSSWIGSKKEYLPYEKLKELDARIHKRFPELKEYRKWKKNIKSNWSDIKLLPSDMTMHWLNIACGWNF